MRHYSDDGRYLAAFLNIFSFDDSGSATASSAYVQFIDDIKYGYSKLDTVDVTGLTLDKTNPCSIYVLEKKRD